MVDLVRSGPVRETTLMGECPKLLFWWERRLDSAELLLGNSSETNEGSAVHVWCQPNYVLRGSQVVRCTHGAWEPATPWCGDKEVFELNIPWIIIIICCIVIFLVFLCSFYWCCKGRKKTKKKAEEFKYYQEQRSKVYYPPPAGGIIYHEQPPEFGRSISDKDTYETREPPLRPQLAYPGVYHREVHRTVEHEAPPPQVTTEVVHHRHQAPRQEVRRVETYDPEPPREVTTEVVHHKYKGQQNIHNRYETHEYEEEGEDNRAYEGRVRRTEEYEEDQPGPSHGRGMRRTVEEEEGQYGRGVRRTVEEEEGQAYGRGVRRTEVEESVATTGGRTRRMHDWFAQYRKWYGAFSGKLGNAATKVFRRGPVPTSREIHVTEYEDQEPDQIETGIRRTTTNYGATAYGEGGLRRTTYEDQDEGFGVGVRRTTVEEDGQGYGVGVHRTTYDAGATAYGGAQLTTFETDLEGQRRAGGVTTTTTRTEVEEGPTYYESHNPNRNDPDRGKADKVYTWKGGKIDIVEDDDRDYYEPSEVYDA